MLAVTIATDAAQNFTTTIGEGVCFLWVYFPSYLEQGKACMLSGTEYKDL
jgi:hypothetical protein